MEKRRHSRVRFNAEVAVKSGGAAISGTIENLSMKGMLFKPDHPVNAEDPVEITLSLSGSDIAIKLMGAVVRQTEAGIAIKFNEMDLDSFTHLRMLVAYNSENPDAIEDEFFHTAWGE